MKLTSIIIFMALFFSGVAHAAPTKIDDRVEYSTSLNTIATVVMNWYGSLISDSPDETRTFSFDSQFIGNEWTEYRSQYPKNISQIIITSTDLLKLDNNDGYQFNVQSTIISPVENGTQKQSLSETFVFKSSLLTSANHLPIKSINRDSENEIIEPSKISNLPPKQYNRLHYKVREFTYAWLSYIDGIRILKSTMNGSTWLDKAPYTLNMGSDRSTGTVDSILEKKKQLLTTGGHLLRSLEIKDQSDDLQSFVIDLVLEWKGTNVKGKPVVARIHQKINIHIAPDNSWEVKSISETHLLPISEPWMGLVC